MQLLLRRYNCMSSYKRGTHWPEQVFLRRRSYAFASTCDRSSPNVSRLANKRLPRSPHRRCCWDCPRATAQWSYWFPWSPKQSVLHVLYRWPPPRTRTRYCASGPMPVSHPFLHQYLSSAAAFRCSDRSRRLTSNCGAPCDIALHDSRIYRCTWLSLSSTTGGRLREPLSSTTSWKDGTHWTKLLRRVFVN